jgi:methionyl-tRNA formyltransferase
MLHVLKAHIADMENAATPHDLQPGALKADKKHVWAGTKTQPLELLEVKAQGKKAMVAADWARGAHLADNAYCD